MLPFELSSADLDTVKVERKNHTSARVRNRLWVLWLLHQGFRRFRVAQLVSCSKDMVTDVVRSYQQYGLEGLLQPQRGSSKSKHALSKHALRKRFKKVKRSLIKRGVHTVRQAQAYLADKFNYTASWESCRRLLHRLGLRRRKINPFPGNPKRFKQWRKAQRKWIKHLRSLHRKAAKGKSDLVFADAAHFVHGKCGAYLWSDGPRYKATGSGRYRLNVYGAYDPVNKQLLSQYSEDNVNAQYVIGFLKWLREQHYPDQSRALHFVLDNARYQHCPAVRQLAASLNIVLEFQPSYSPNLNLIERAWKYFKSLVGRAYCDTKEEFVAMITNILHRTDSTEHQRQFETLLTMNFQTYKKSEILGG